jgi:uncharacterized protein (DUF362 family)
MNGDAKITRRAFIRDLTLGGGALFLMPGMADKLLDDSQASSAFFSRIYASRNGSVYQNVEKVVELMGGIETIIGRHDIVVLKPNCQWWNQGTTNVSAMRKFIELILDIPGFDGEIIVAENHQKYVADEFGWTYPNVINGDPDAINLNALIELFHDRGYPNVTKCHWINEENQGGNVVAGPLFGDGYVRTNIKYTYDGRETIMTYPIFTSAYSGTRLDFRYGVWSRGRYTDTPFKFVNFAVLNDHWLGVTSSVKNHLGVVELPGRDDGMFPEGYYNFHSIGNEGRQAMGGAIGAFLQTIRQPDLNIVTAEWVGWGNRVDPARAAQARTILASTDPVALDFWGAKYVLLPHTPDDYPKKHYHDPERTDREFYKYLNECHQQGVGTMNEQWMIVELFDFQPNTGVPYDNQMPSSVASVGQNYPNPFNSSTLIPFFLSRKARVTVRILNNLGQHVNTLIDTRMLSSGNHRVRWDGMNDQKQTVPSGIYVCEFIVDRNRWYTKIVFKK